MKELLERVVDYIERMEEVHDAECGYGRSIQEIIEQDEMPDIYSDVFIELTEMGK